MRHECFLTLWGQSMESLEGKQLYCFLIHYKSGLPFKAGKKDDSCLRTVQEFNNFGTPEVIWRRMEKRGSHIFTVLALVQRLAEWGKQSNGRGMAGEKNGALINFSHNQFFDAFKKFRTNFMCVMSLSRYKGGQG